MALPSRAAFLQTGLTPISTTTTSTPSHNLSSSTSPATPTECSVCVSTPTSPVRLPCSHTFCKSCITSWLSAPGKNSCAVCRTQFFNLPQGETDDRGTEGGQGLRNAAALALRTSGLAALMISTGAGDLPSAFGAETTGSNLQRATAAGVRFLAAGERELGSEGVEAEKEFLAAYLIAIGYLIPALAGALGRPYDADLRRAWDVIVAKVWTAVGGLDGQDLTAADLEGKSTEAVTAAGVEGFGEGSGREADVRELVKFLVLQAQERLRQRESVRTYKKHHRGIWGKERKGCAAM